MGYRRIDGPNFFAYTKFLHILQILPSGWLAGWLGYRTVLNGLANRPGLGKLGENGLEQARQERSLQNAWDGVIEHSTNQGKIGYGLGQGILGQAVLGRAVLGQEYYDRVLGQPVLGQAVIGQAVIGQAVLGQAVIGQTHTGICNITTSSIRRGNIMTWSIRTGSFKYLCSRSNSRPLQSGRPLSKLGGRSFKAHQDAKSYNVNQPG